MRDVTGCCGPMRPAGHVPSITVPTAMPAPGTSRPPPSWPPSTISSNAMPMPRTDRRLRILTWHVHGNYLYYLSQVPHDFWLVTRPGDPPGHAGRGGQLPWGGTVHEVPEARRGGRPSDCVLYQSPRHYLEDRLRVRDDDQRALPAIFLEHDPPREHPTDTLHPVQDERILLVHVTHFNALMWD